MIMWRGWGILALLYAVAAFGLEILAMKTLAPDGNAPFVFGVGLLLAAAATWFTGVAVNKNRPRRQLATLVDARRAQLNSYVENGTFSLGPGCAPPKDPHEAGQMAEELLRTEELEAASELTNRHTLFFIPLQYWAFVLGAFAVASIVSEAIK